MGEAKSVPSSYPACTPGDPYLRGPQPQCAMRPLLPALVLLALASTGCRSSAEPPEPGLPTAPGLAVRGVTLDARAAPSPAFLAGLADLGVTHVALVPFGFLRDGTAEVAFDPEPGWYAERASSARALAAAGDTLGFEVILKPHLWLGHDGWSGLLGFETEAEWATWEASYRRFVLHHARLAAEIARFPKEIGSPVFVVGTELGRAAREREAFWRGLIAEVRAVYPGALTYAANWHDDAETVPFWDALDYIGVQAYYPLAQPSDTALAVDRLRAAWAPHATALRALSERTGKPVLFTEIGYRSVGYAASEPWRWPERGEDAAPDPALQARLYEAFFQTFWHEPWFAGAIVWKWSEDRSGRPDALGFSFHGKPAEGVLAAWFNRTP